MGNLTREEVERRFPVAVAFARELRPADPDVKILYARNQQGEELGRLDPPLPRERPVNRR